jgi:hypothetical protein
MQRNKQFIRLPRSACRILLLGLLALHTLWSTAVSAAAQPGDEVLVNGGFEDDTGWTFANWGKDTSAGTVQRVDGGRSGKALLLEGQADPVDLLATQHVAVIKPGQRYVLRVWYKTDEAGRAAFSLTSRAANGDELPYLRTGAFGPAADWQQIEWPFTLKRGTAEATLALRTSHRGCVWFDDASLVFQPPDPEVVLWPLNRVVQRDAMVTTGPLQVAFGTGGVPSLVSWDRNGDGQFGAEEEVLKGLSLAAVTDVGAVQSDSFRSLEDGCDVWTGYFQRRSATFGVAGLGRFDRDPLRVQLYTETFRGSPLLYLFSRTDFTRLTELKEYHWTFVTAQTYDQVVTFARNKPETALVADGRKVTYDAATTKPFVVLYDTARQEGLAFFLPLPVELRSWYAYDYDRSVRPAVVEVGAAEGRVTVRFGVEPFKVEPGAALRTTLDLTVYVLPFQGSVADGLATFQVGPPLLEETLPAGEENPGGFWTEHFSEGRAGTEPRPSLGDVRVLRGLRYFPEEGYSFVENTWGNLTHVAALLQTYLPTYDETGHIFWRDLGVRHFQFFLDRADDTGLVPYLLDPSHPWAMILGRPAEQFHHLLHFPPVGEDVLRFAQRFLAEIAADEGDRWRVYRQLQRMQDLFDPAGPVTWTHVLEDGVYWFNYFDGFRAVGYNSFVLYTHAAALLCATHQRELARQMGVERDARFWETVTQRGTDGLLWFAAQDWAWTPEDPNEVRYSRDLRVSSYHVLLARTYLPALIAENDYRRAELEALRERMRQARCMAEG